MVPIMKVMALSLIRDRGALAMAFVLPPVIFLIFASVFAGAGSGDVHIKVAVADTVASSMTKSVLTRLGKSSAINPVAVDTARGVEQAVRRGSADVGLIVRAAGGRTGFVVVQDPAKKVAASVLMGHLRAVLQAPVRTPSAAPQVTLRPLAKAGAGDGSIAYYAGAVAILFLLLTAMQNAVTLQEDREGGILDRLVVSPKGVGALISGRFAFIVLLGIGQVALIFVIAWLLYGVRLPASFLPWLVTTVSAAVCAAGVCLMLVTLCASRRQAQTLGNFAVLIVSAVGGSMIPRFLMPEWLQSVGWLTPNAWVLEAYTGAFWRGAGFGDLALAWGVLLAAGLAGLAVAQIAGRRFERI